MTAGIGSLALCLVSCDQPVPTAAPGAGTEVAAGPLARVPVQDIMLNLMAPAMDAALNLPDVLADPKAAAKATPDEIDAAWTRVRRGAISLTEIPNLVVMEGRPITRPGGTVTGEGVGDYLHAAEIAQLFRTQRQELLEAAQKMNEFGMTVQAAAEKRDVKALLDLGVDIEVVCEGCHSKFWYPPKAAATAPR